MSYRLSVIVPVFNEEALMSELMSRFQTLVEVLERRSIALSQEIEVIFVNDGSKDGTLPLLIAASHSYPWCKVVDLSRNFGHQVAVSAGLDFSTGDAVAIIDGDLQDPPELLADMLVKLSEGFDVVYGVRRVRKNETLFKRATAALFYRLLRVLTSVDIPLDTGDFRVMSRRVTDVLCDMPEKHRFLRGLVSWIGFKQIGFEYDRDERFAGETKYPLSKMIAFALDGITSFSTTPLRLIGQLGYLVVLVGFFYAIYVLYAALILGVTVEGWTSTVLIVLIMGGVQLISLGIIGNYVGRNHVELKKRPLYVVRDVYSFME
jgi:glycosyltransferase involved in cell wall biosynthesis